MTKLKDFLGDKFPSEETVASLANLEIDPSKVRYRGKRVRSEEWVEGFYFSVKYCNKLRHFIGDSDGNYQIDPSTLTMVMKD